MNREKIEKLKTEMAKKMTSDMIKFGIIKSDSPLVKTTSLSWHFNSEKEKQNGKIEDKDKNQVINKKAATNHEFTL